MSRPQFGNRFLDKDSDVFKHNAWDNVEWDDEQEKIATNKVEQNSEVCFSTVQLEQFESKASDHWDAFYSVHQNRFFKDRHWLFTEFPELSQKTAEYSNDKSTNPNMLQSCNEKEPPNAAMEGKHKEGCNSGVESGLIKSTECIKPEGSPKLCHSKLDVEKLQILRKDESFIGANSRIKLFEVGCGAGNTVFPLLEANIDEGLFVYACDFSQNAVNIVQSHPDYNLDRCLAFRCDLSSDEWETPFPEESLDIITCVFVLSALQPERIGPSIHKLSRHLKPGGVILFRDYGRYDMAQLRFKKGRCLGENFYARGDGTRCYFFTQEDIKSHMESAGLVEIQNLVDRRLQVNRGKQLKMYRVWLQAKYQKPANSNTSVS